MITTKKLPSRAVKVPALVRAVFPSELGWMAAIFSQEALVRLTFGHRTRAEAVAAIEAGEDVADASEKLPPALAGTIARLQAFAAGGKDELAKIVVDYGVVTPFQQRVLNGCRGIAPGETLSYAQLAVIAGAPGAARAVGNVMRTNKMPLVVPCHRVVGSGGALGGYSAPEGLVMKRKLLEREGAGSREKGPSSKGQVPSKIQRIRKKV